MQPRFGYEQYSFQVEKSAGGKGGQNLHLKFGT